jgi:hypothetical protein
MRAARARVRCGGSSGVLSEPDAPTAAIEEFRFDLIDRFATAKLEAIDLATIAWKATQAGAGGVSDLGVDPKQKGGNHASKIRSALGLDVVAGEVLFRISVPMWDAATGARVVSELPVKLPHEAICREFMNNKASYWKARSDSDWIDVPAFLEHPVTKQFGVNECWPCGYYTDKVKLGRESFYRGSAKCTVMRASITCWVIKCTLLCRCGCNGACTVDAIQMEMNYSLNCLQNGVYMMSRFDNKPFLASEASRARRAGTNMQFRGVVNEYRADLPERCAMARIKTHQGTYGCIECHERATHLHDRVAEASIFSVPWVPRTQDSYLDEVGTHLVGVKINDAIQRDALAASLVWIDAYPWGRRVSERKGARWGLAAGDQLIVSDAIRCPHDLESLAPPFEVFFFRPRKESGLSGVSLMWNVPGVHSLGIDWFEVQYFCECTLHTLDLGVSQRFCGTAIVRALRSNVYNLPYKGARQRIRRGCMRMSKDITKYYKDERAKNPWKQLSTLSKQFSMLDLGDLNRPCLRAKGGETRGLVKFCTGLMKKFDCGPRGKLLAKAGEALLENYEVMETESRRMSFESRQRLVTSMVNHVVLYKAAGGHLVHKHHGAVHMALKAGTSGNPKCVATYEDEHENGVIARIGIHVHGATFAKSVFERLELQNPERKVRKILE